MTRGQPQNWQGANPEKFHFWHYPWYSFGQKLEGYEGEWVNERAVRARAGLLLLIGFICLGSFFYWRWFLMLKVGPWIVFDFFVARTWGISVSPLGMLATWLVRKYPPEWRAAKPKQFAWTIGVFCGLPCVLIRWYYGLHPILPFFVYTCIALTWLESSVGFCLGCWLYKKLYKFTGFKSLECKPCSDGSCALPSANASKQQTAGSANVFMGDMNGAQASLALNKQEKAAIKIALHGNRKAEWRAILGIAAAAATIIAFQVMALGFKYKTVLNTYTNF